MQSLPWNVRPSSLLALSLRHKDSDLSFISYRFIMLLRFPNFKLLVILYARKYQFKAGNDAVYESVDNGQG